MCFINRLESLVAFMASETSSTRFFSRLVASPASAVASASLSGWFCRLRGLIGILSAAPSVRFVVRGSFSPLGDKERCRVWTSSDAVCEASCLPLTRPLRVLSAFAISEALTGLRALPEPEADMSLVFLALAPPFLGSLEVPIGAGATGAKEDSLRIEIVVTVIPEVTLADDELAVLSGTPWPPFACFACIDDADDWVDDGVERSFAPPLGTGWPAN